MLSEYQSLRKRYWGQHLWARGYWVASSDNVTDEVWMKYIEDQKPPEPDDPFKVVLGQSAHGPINPASAVPGSQRL
ncbi:MAG: transposase [Beijerinckiaceae bacterium]